LGNYQKQFLHKQKRQKTRAERATQKKYMEQIEKKNIARPEVRKKFELIKIA
jgi:hypothetical protein